MSLTLLIVLAIFFIFGIVGFARGLFKKLFTIIALVACIFIAGALTGPVSDWVMENTKLSSSVEGGVYSLLDKKASEDPVLSSEKASHRLSEYELSYITANPSSVLDTVDEYLGGLKLPVNLKKTMAATEDDVRKEALNAGASIRSMILRSAATRISALIVRIIVYLSICLVVYIGLRIIFGVLRLAGKFKAVSAVDHVGGLLLGLGEGLLLVWIFMMFVTILSNFSIGQGALDQIGKNGMLKALYDSNLLWNFVKF